MTMSRKIGFFVPPQVSLLGLDCALDTLRVANSVLRRQFYTWCTIGTDDLHVRSSNGIQMVLDRTIENDISDLDMLFACSTPDISRYSDRRVTSWLARAARQIDAMGGITSGAFLLARAGLLKGYSCAVHWQDVEAFREDFPDVTASGNIFVIDRNRYTSAGGLVTIDLFLQIIAQDVGASVALSMLGTFQKDRVRDQNDPQTWSLNRGTRERPKSVLLAVNLMEQNIEVPLKLEQIAARIGMTSRNLHRIFKMHLHQSPSDCYRDIRMRKARALLRTTSRSVLDVSISCGFESQSAFSRSYLSRFGMSPSADRDAKVQD